MSSKIPGVLTAPPKTEVDGVIANLNVYTLTELKELLARQDKILTNEIFVSKLPDKGEKIAKFRNKILQEISDKSDVDKASSLLASLSIVDVEWKINGKTANNVVQLDSDDDTDDEEDPLRIIAQSAHQKKSLVVLPKEKSLITEADLEDNTVLDPHIRYICDKTTKEDAIRTKFKPYKTTKSDSHDPSKEKLRKKGKHWEVTAATPPAITHEPVKVLSLHESLNLQKQYTNNLKEIQAKQAAEKLATQLGFKIGETPKLLSNYRNNESDTESENSETNKHEINSDEEVNDDEVEKGGVVFTVLN